MSLNEIKIKKKIPKKNQLKINKNFLIGKILYEFTNFIIKKTPFI